LGIPQDPQVNNKESFPLGGRDAKGAREVPRINKLGDTISKHPLLRLPPHLKAIASYSPLHLLLFGLYSLKFLDTVI
jgi:hypothetical protein